MICSFCGAYSSRREQQIEHNLKFDFSLTGEDGKALEPVFGAGLTGLQNLGNRYVAPHGLTHTLSLMVRVVSCYMASVMQTVFSLPGFRERYYPSCAMHWVSCPEALPANCIECQMHKLADGLL